MSYDVFAGEVLAIVGESGSGKTQSARWRSSACCRRTARVRGSAKLAARSCSGCTAQKLREVRGNEIAMIFQEPMTALNPVYTVGFQIIETLRTHFDIGPSRRASGPSSCSSSSRSRTRDGVSTPTRTSCPAASVSAR